MGLFRLSTVFTVPFKKAAMQVLDRGFVNHQAPGLIKSKLKKMKFRMKILNIKLAVVVVLLCASLAGLGQNSNDFSNGFEITGKFKGLPEGEKIQLTLIYIDEHNNYNGLPVATTTVKNEEFRFEGFVPDGPRAYLIEFRGKILPIHLNNKEKALITIINNENINTIKSGYLENYVNISGSNTATAAILLMRPIINYKQSILFINEYIKKMRDSIGFDPATVGAMLATRELITSSFFYNYINTKDPNITPARFQFIDALFDWEYGQHSPFLMQAYNLATEVEKNSHFGKKLEKWASLSLGQKFPDFSLPNPHGKTVQLNSIVEKGKMTIVHFWATNSTESRSANEKELSVLYKKYHDKGLNIVAISADTADYIWKGYLQVNPDLNAWYNVSDLKGFQKGSIIQDRYLEGGHKIPNTTNVILDSKGQIVAWIDADSRQASTELQFYIWKTFEQSSKK